MNAKKPISKIASYREGVKLTQLELSQKVGVTETTIANWERGRSGLDWIERVIRLCDALRCAPGDLLEYPEQMEGTQSEVVPPLSQVHAYLGVDQLTNPSTTRKGHIGSDKTSTTDCQETPLSR